MTELSREAILAMVPGIELSKLVAVNVLGWEERGQLRGRDPQGNINFYPNCSTDISAAIEIIYKVTDKAEREGCGPCVRIEHDGKWHAKIGFIQSVADTLPEAICKVSLLKTLEAFK